MKKKKKNLNKEKIEMNQILKQKLDLEVLLQGIIFLKRKVIKLEEQLFIKNKKKINNKIFKY